MKNMARVPAPPDKLPRVNPGALARIQDRFQRVAAWSSRRTSTTATAGTASALPSPPAGFLDVEVVDSTTGIPARKKVPYYNP
jgi:hypothetical protein